MTTHTFPLILNVANGSIICMQGKELKVWRKKHQLTQMEIAKHLHVDRITIWRWEAELRAIPPFLFLALEALEYRLMRGGDQGQTTMKPKSIRKEVKRNGKSISKKTQKRKDG